MLLDFNLSQCQATDEARAAATLGGTVAYMAPEHLRALAARDPALARQVDHRADLYSLGMVLYEMLAGRSPFDQSASYSPLPALIEAMADERSRAWPSLRRHRPDVPWGLESIARKCLAPAPQDRYQQAGHLAEDLRRFLDDLPLAHAPELSVRERLGKWARRHPRLTASSAVAGVAALLLLTAANLLLGTRTALTAAQARAYEAEAAEAREQKQHFQEGHRKALCLVNTTTDLQGNIRAGRAVCEETLALYGVLDGDGWERHRLWQRLPPEDRGALAEDVRDLLLLLARARAYLAAAAADPHLARTVGAALLPLAGAPGWFAAAAGQSLWAPQAESLRAAGQASLGEALRLLDRAEGIPGLLPSAALWEDRADYLERLGRAAGARAARERASHLPARDVRDHYRQATALAFRGRYAEAVGVLDEVLRRDPQHYWSRVQRGLCRTALGKHDLALADFEACVALWPEFAWSRFNRGRALDQLGEKAAAVADYGEALRLDPTFMAAHLNRGLALLQLRQHLRALADFDRALALGQDSASLHAGRGLALEGMGRHAEADTAFAEARRRDPHNSRTALAYAFAVYPRLPEEARAAFAEVLRQEPRSTHALYGLGMLAAHHDRGSPEALALFTRALEIDPAFLEARRGRALVLAHQGDFDEAHKDIALCLRANASGATLYAGACVYALLAERCGDAGRVRWCRERALVLLRLAFQAGYGTDRAAADDDLAALRGLPQFERLVRRSELR
jgi:tetratricopeptide (TPR) repeat protein